METNYIVHYICGNLAGESACETIEDAERVAKGLVLILQTESTSKPELTIQNVKTGEVKPYFY